MCALALAKAGKARATVGMLAAQLAATNHTSVGLPRNDAIVVVVVPSRRVICPFGAARPVMAGAAVLVAPAAPQAVSRTPSATAGTTHHGHCTHRGAARGSWARPR